MQWGFFLVVIVHSNLAISFRGSKYLPKIWSSLSLIYFVKIWPPDFLCNEILIKMYRPKIWSSLSLIYFVKIRPPDFLCNEILIKMYRLLQNYTFEISNLSKILNICCKCYIFTGRSLFTSNRKVDTWFLTHIQWFATVVLTRFSFS